MSESVLTSDEDNVIMFPFIKEGAPATRKELEELVLNNKREVATDVAIVVTKDIVGGLVSMGFDVTEHEDSGYDVALLLEIIKAMIMRSQGLDNKLLEVTKEMVPLENHDITPKTFLNQLLGIAEE